MKTSVPIKDGSQGKDSAKRKERLTRAKQKSTPWKYNAPVNPMFLGAQRPRNGQDY
jgi:hypothetical protein